MLSTVSFSSVWSVLVSIESFDEIPLVNVSDVSVGLKSSNTRLLVGLRLCSEGLITVTL